MAAGSPGPDKAGVGAEFTGIGDGKPPVMRFIIRDQAGMVEYWGGSDFLVTADVSAAPSKFRITLSR